MSGGGGGHKYLLPPKIYFIPSNNCIHNVNSRPYINKIANHVIYTSRRRNINISSEFYLILTQIFASFWVPPKKITPACHLSTHSKQTDKKIGLLSTLFATTNFSSKLEPLFTSARLKSVSETKVIPKECSRYGRLWVNYGN